MKIHELSLQHKVHILYSLQRKPRRPDRGSKYLLLSNRSNLNSDQIERLAITLEKSECLKIAYEMKEEFREIYETNMTVKIAQTKFKDWLNYATIVNHFEGICNYFLNRTTSGVMSGINNRIKLIMRQGYGFSNFDNF
jgi:transposase